MRKRSSRGEICSSLHQFFKISLPDDTLECLLSQWVGGWINHQGTWLLARLGKKEIMASLLCSSQREFCSDYFILWVCSLGLMSEPAISCRECSGNGTEMAPSCGFNWYLTDNHAEELTMFLRTCFSGVILLRDLRSCKYVGNFFFCLFFGGCFWFCLHYYWLMVVE